ncbi:helix-turn-helix transcriptional regulator [Sphingosinicella terrae]|uniref:helix-turn-helix transcriptional regulator n=1 Tax=Sphingosinicella terrae TaxID=2172047 RepID=UPI000E0CE8FD|nr:helix-turn-helix transcriptional regulator [Sphingosinicella terrae]
MNDYQIAGSIAAGKRHIAVATAALACLDAHIRPMAIVDEELRLLWTNQRASDLFRETTELDDRGGFLTLENPDHHARLTALVSRSGPDLITYCMPLASGAGHLLIRARRLDCGETVMFGIQITRTDSDDHDIYYDLDKAFGLTAAEHRVLLALLTGKDADRLTRDLGVSIETVRTHIRNIYAKLDVNSREKLFAKVQPFRI